MVAGLLVERRHAYSRRTARHESASRAEALVEAEIYASSAASQLGRRVRRRLSPTSQSTAPGCPRRGPPELINPPAVAARAKRRALGLSHACTANRLGLLPSSPSSKPTKLSVLQRPSSGSPWCSPQPMTPSAQTLLSWLRRSSSRRSPFTPSRLRPPAHAASLRRPARRAAGSGSATHRGRRAARRFPYCSDTAHYA